MRGIYPKRNGVQAIPETGQKSHFRQNIISLYWIWYVVSLADKSAEIKPKFFWYRDASRGKKEGARTKEVCPLRKRFLTLVSNHRGNCISRRHLDIIQGTCQLLYTDIYFPAYLLRPNGSLADCNTLLCPNPRSPGSDRSISPSKELERPKENIIVSHSLLLRGLVITLQMERRGSYRFFPVPLVYAMTGRIFTSS